jgi:hypothetical protein
MIKITPKLITKIHTLLDAGLVCGVGKPEPGQMCVEAAICYALGLPHGDDPKCVLPVLRSIKISLNDQFWSSNAARAEGMRRLAIAQLGSDELDTKDFLMRVARMTIQTMLPSALRSAAKVLTGEHPTKLLAIALKCEQEPIEANALYAIYAANAASYAARAAIYAASAASYATNAASYATSYTAGAASAATNAASYAARAASYATNAASYATSYTAGAASAASYAASYAARAAAARASPPHAASDKVLGTFAENIVQILITMNAPGTAWL